MIYGSRLVEEGSEVHEKVCIELRKGNTSERLKVRKGLSLMALKSLTEMVEFDCQKGDCGICVFTLHQGKENLNPPNNIERDFLKAMGAQENERLACQCRVYGSIELEVEDFDP